jgi:outer membrane biosynthesis protein TonB
MEKYPSMRSLLLLTFTLILTTVVSSQDVQPKLLSMPEYILPASVSGIGGSIYVNVWLTKEGIVLRSQVIGGPGWGCGKPQPTDAVLDARIAAEAAVKKARFSPALQYGEPVDSVAIVPVIIGEKSLTAKIPSADKTPNNQKPPVQGSLEVGGIVNGKATYLPQPDVYQLRRSGEKTYGSVEVEVLVDEKGEVVSAGAISGPPVLQGPARDAACKALFSPTLLSGQPVKVSGRITYNFVP